MDTVDFIELESHQIVFPSEYTEENLEFVTLQIDESINRISLEYQDVDRAWIGFQMAVKLHDRVFELYSKSNAKTKIAVGAILVGLFASLFSSVVGKLISKAKSELNAWDGFTETSVKATPYLKKYWQAVNLPLQPSDIAWSAAFISYIMGNEIFSPDQSHIGYARKAYQSRLRGDKGKYWAYAPSEISKVRKGDILVKARSGSGATFNDVRVNTGFLPTHGDLVISVANGYAKAIGGNVSNKVSVSNYPLFGNKPSSEVFTVLRKA